MGERIGLRTIAERAGVAPATVSRVLNGCSKGFSVRPAVRERVLAAAAALNYRPDIVAQSLRRTRTGMIGILGRHVPLNLPEGLLQSLLRVFSPLNMHLNIYCLPDHSPYQQLPPWRLDGAVAYGATGPAEIAGAEEAGVPYVSINGYAGPHGDAVQYDDAGGMRLALDHLYSLGHRRIAYAAAGGRYQAHRSVAERYDAYRQFLRERRITPVPGHDLPMADDWEERVNRWVRQDGATAIVAYHLYAAMGLLQAAQRLGVSIPHECSLICFNDEHPIAFLNPRLTAVRLPIEAAAERGAQMLMRRIADPGRPSETVVLGEQLTVRESTGPAPKGR